jgi:4'-phosphopantetheinyl transferase
MSAIAKDWYPVYSPMLRLVSNVEYIRPFSPYAAQHVLSEQEMEDLRCAPDPDRRFFVYWTLKESCVKAMGTGLATPMKQVVFRVEDDTVECITQPGYRFLLLESSGPYITAACFLGGGNSARICEKDDGGIYGKIFQIETASL